MLHTYVASSDPGEQQRSLVALPEQRLVVHDIPDPVGHLLEANVLAVEHSAKNAPPPKGPRNSTYSRSGLPWGFMIHHAPTGTTAIGSNNTAQYAHPRSRANPSPTRATQHGTESARTVGRNQGAVPSDPCFAMRDIHPRSAASAAP